MIISKNTLHNITTDRVSLPEDGLLNLPEKVLQFGTGVLLRGLPDYFVDKGNRRNSFNGRIAVVKSTAKGDINDFLHQDNLYTICIRGIENGQRIEENILSSSISRVLSADGDWEEILKIAQNIDLKIIVSNTTEVGIQLVEELIQQSPPSSFPAKLLAVLHKRFSVAGDNEDADIVVIATELIPDNGKKLEKIVYELAAFNQLDETFLKWLKKHVYFCNSLVDRIVPGKPDVQALSKLQQQLGYSDNLLIMAEPYRLWAIEGNERVSALLNLEDADHGVIVKPDIEIYRELKIRLLNGPHTLACGIALLSGIDTVCNAMENVPLKNYIARVMQSEIIPAIPYEVEHGKAVTFANAVLDRFANPYIEHLWINITFQYSMKLKIRILPVLFQYYKLFDKAPANIAFGFAAYLIFMKIDKKEGDKYFGSYKGNQYLITDDQAAYFYEKSELNDTEYVRSVLSDQDLWGTDLSKLNGFIEIVKENYDYISKNGMISALIKGS